LPFFVDQDRAARQRARCQVDLRLDFQGRGNQGSVHVDGVGAFYRGHDDSVAHVGRGACYKCLRPLGAEPFDEFLVVHEAAGSDNNRICADTNLLPLDVGFDTRNPLFAVFYFPVDVQDARSVDDFNLLLLAEFGQRCDQLFTVTLGLNCPRFRAAHGRLGQVKKHDALFLQPFYGLAALVGDYSGNSRIPFVLADVHGVLVEIIGRILDSEFSLYGGIRRVEPCRR